MATLANEVQSDRSSRGLDPSVREHYLIERQLATKLRSASREERRALYTEVYNELFRRFPQHRQLQRKLSPEQLATRTALQMALLGPLISADKTFMEIGPGDCALSFHVAQRARFVHAVDVSDEVTRRTVQPSNFKLFISDGTSIPVQPGSIDLAYSNQLMEHLHPDDAIEQLRNIYRALAPGAVYVCITPSRLTGPHDVSRYFDTEATCFHLKEYTAGELRRLLHGVGFRDIRVAVGARSRFVWIPAWCLAPVEGLLLALPPRLRRTLARGPLFRWMLGVRLLARKPAH